MQPSPLPQPALLADEPERYTRTAVLLHWLVAGAIATMVFLGWWMLSIPKEPAGPRVRAFNLHKSIGIVVFWVMVARLMWRLMHRPPALPPLPLWQQRAAAGVHALLYASVFLMPLSGFMASSFSGRPVVFFGNALPVWLARNEAVSEFFYRVHFVVSWVLVTAVAVHVLAALRHHWIERDDVLRRMLWQRSPGRDRPYATIANQRNN
jgi:cytochrome b561